MVSEIGGDWGNEPPDAGKKDVKWGKDTEKDQIPKDWQPSQSTIEAISKGKLSQDEEDEPERSEGNNSNGGSSQTRINSVQGKSEGEK